MVLQSSRARPHRGSRQFGHVVPNGLGFSQDIIKAHMWYTISAVNGGLSAHVRAHIEDRMSPYQIDKAQQMARVCVAKNYKGC